jgi:hypothetical protein
MENMSATPWDLPSTIYLIKEKMVVEVDTHTVLKPGEKPTEPGYYMVPGSGSLHFYHNADLSPEPYVLYNSRLPERVENVYAWGKDGQLLYWGQDDDNTPEFVNEWSTEK